MANKYTMTIKALLYSPAVCAQVQSSFEGQSCLVSPHFIIVRSNSLGSQSLSKLLHLKFIDLPGFAFVHAILVGPMPRK